MKLLQDLDTIDLFKIIKSFLNIGAWSFSF